MQKTKLCQNSASGIFFKFSEICVGIQEKQRKEKARKWCEMEKDGR